MWDVDQVISPLLGRSGRVLAIDIRRISLLFLRARLALRGYSNVILIHSEPDNPELEAQSVDAVLIANTLHEIADQNPVLSCIFRSLKPGGRIVVVDRGSKVFSNHGSELDRHPHTLSLSLAADEVRQAGFEIISEDDEFIDRPGIDAWWLLVARKPTP